MIASLVVVFFYRRTRHQLLYYAWLGLIWLETQARKWRDRKGGKRGA